MRDGWRNLLERRSTRWFAPVIAALAIGAVAALSNISAGASIPDLPPITPQQLLVKVQQANVPDFSGTVQVTANLGLPDLSSIESDAGSSGGPGDGFDPLNWLSGTNSAQVEVAPGEARVRILSSLSEEDIIVNHDDVWLWDSSDLTATHLVLSGDHPAPGTPGLGGSTTAAALTPARAADELLAAISPSTAVTVSTNTTVGGRPAYQLELVPDAAGSTIGEISIAVDSATGLPLQVSVTARGASAPALVIGFTSFSTATPPSGDFNFTPAPGVKVTTHVVTRWADQASSSHSQVIGQDWSSVLVLHNVNPQGTSGTTPTPVNALAGLISRAATPVSGSFGSGRLFQSTLLNAVLTSDGRLAVGFVTPASLESALAPSS